MWVRYWEKRQTKQIILLSGRNRELWSRLHGDSDEQIGKTLSGLSWNGAWAI